MKSLKAQVHNKPLPFLVLCFLLLKISYLLFAQATNNVNPEQNLLDQYLSIVHKFDSDWYQIIAENGYPEIIEPEDLGYSKGADIKQSEWAFFPFYPMLAKGFMNISGLSFPVTGLILNLIFSMLCLIGFYLFSKFHFKEKNKAILACAILFLFPFSFYFSMLYTEAIFFTALIFSLVYIQRRNYFLMSLCLIPLCLLRPNGLILLLPLYLYLLEDRNMITRRLNISNLLKWPSLKWSLLFLTGILSFTFYCFYQLYQTGDFFAFSSAQAGWGREFTFPLLALFRKSSLANQFNSVYSILLILFTISQLKKWPISFNVLVWLSILLPLSSGSVTSMTRFTILIFPIFLSLSAMVSKLQAKWLVFVTVTILHFGSFYFWLENMPVAF